jgi:hypothetical protein
MHNLSDELLCDRWVENPYFQYFCGEVVFRHELPFDRNALAERIVALADRGCPNSDSTQFLVGQLGQQHVGGYAFSHGLRSSTIN